MVDVVVVEVFVELDGGGIEAGDGVVAVGGARGLGLGLAFALGLGLAFALGLGLAFALGLAVGFEAGVYRETDVVVGFPSTGLVEVARGGVVVLLVVVVGGVRRCTGRVDGLRMGE
jgi:hypothetical protein